MMMLSLKRDSLTCKFKKNAASDNDDVERRLYLFPRGPRQDKRRKNRQGVLGVSWPALNHGPHGQAEHGH